MMKRYLNLSGESGVRAYLPGPDAIAVEFLDGSVYLYTSDSAGIDTIAHMLELAERGRGLSAYISQHVGDAYAQKLR